MRANVLTKHLVPEREISENLILLITWETVKREKLQVSPMIEAKTSPATSPRYRKKQKSTTDSESPRSKESIGWFYFWFRPDLSKLCAVLLSLERVWRFNWLKKCFGKSGKIETVSVFFSKTKCLSSKLKLIYNTILECSKSNMNFFSFDLNFFLVILDVIILKMIFGCSKWYRHVECFVYVMIMMFIKFVLLFSEIE